MNFYGLSKLLLLPSLTVLSVACSGSDSDGSNSSSSGTASGGSTSTGGGSGTGESTQAAIQRAVAQVRACELIGDGEFGELPGGEYFTCLASCLADADCMSLEAFACSDAEGAVSECAANCEELVHVCGDGTPLDEGVYQCDGAPDCADESDEVGCSYFTCADGTELISLAYRCDEEPDCTDGSDESGCAPTLCP